MWGIHDTARALCQEFPPDDYVYLSLGNSPSPVTLYIQRAFPTCRMLHLPITGLVPGYAQTTADYVRRMVAPLPREKPWVVVDISASGASLAAIKLILESLPLKKRSLRISYVAINRLSPDAGALLDYDDEELLELLGGGFSNARIFKLRKFSGYQEALAGALTDAFTKSDPFGLRLYRTLEQAQLTADNLNALMRATRDVPGIALLIRFLVAVRRFNADRGALAAAWEWDESERAWF
jgi:hypothetical protein